MPKEAQASHGRRFLGLKRFDVAVLLLALLAITATIVIVAVSASSTADLTGKKSVSLTIKDGKLSQTNIAISPNTTVTWTNEDAVEHSVMHQHDNDEHAHAATTRDNLDPDVFSSPALEQGESYSFTFKEAGSTKYHDSLHPSITGTVTVR